MKRIYIEELNGYFGVFQGIEMQLFTDNKSLVDRLVSNLLARGYEIVERI